MKEFINAVSFLAIGKTQESTEGNGFTRYIGVGSSYVLAVNPTKAEADAIMGYDTKEPEYINKDENGIDQAKITFIVRTDPNTCGGIEITNFLTFTLRKAPKISDKGSIIVIDKYGNSTYVPKEDAEAKKPLPTNYKIDQKNYRIAADGEADLVAFLKAYLSMPSALDYKGGAWVVKDNAGDALFELEHIKDYFKGDFSEIKEAIKLRPNNKVKLLYGVKTEDGRQKQKIATKGDLILRNASSNYEKLEKDLASAKRANLYEGVEFKVCELQAYDIEPTNLDKSSSNNSTQGLWDSTPTPLAPSSDSSDDVMIGNPF